MILEEREPFQLECVKFRIFKEKLIAFYMKFGQGFVIKAYYILFSLMIRKHITYKLCNLQNRSKLIDHFCK